MAIQDISNLPISASFQNILQRSGSVIGTATGTQVDNLDISASYALNAGTADNATSATTAISASHAVQADSALAANTATSASHALNADNAISSSHALNADDAISSSYAITASHALSSADAVDTGSLLTTASISDATITFEKGDASTFAITVDNVDTASVAISSSHALNADSAISASYATFAQNADEANDLVINVKNVSGGTLAIGTAVHAVGVTGENINIVTASADQPANMPAIAVLSQEISNNGNGTAIINGRLSGINTANLVAGAPVYVNKGGLFTALKPTGSSLIQNIGTAAKINGSDGEIILQGSGRSNDVPNITENYLWVGNSDQVATPTDKDALTVGTASLALDVISTANLNVASISASSAVFTSASIGYLESISGSAKIIGDAFIILNNDTPTQRYAGIAVQDSGSVGVTSSFQFDGQTNDWFYEYSDDGGVTTDHGVAMFGPEYNSIGAPIYNAANTILKGDGGHHMLDSNITDDGTTIVLGSNVEITGSLGITGAINGSIQNAISASHAVNADNAISASHAVQADSALSATSATTAVSASHAVQADSALAANTATSASHAIIADSALTATSATTAVSASHAVQADSALAANTATSSSHALNADDAISSSYATSASIADYQKNLNSNSGSIQLWQGSKTAYDAISGSASNDVLYFVIE